MVDDDGERQRRREIEEIITGIRQRGSASAARRLLEEFRRLWRRIDDLERER